MLPHPMVRDLGVEGEIVQLLGKQLVNCGAEVDTLTHQLVNHTV